ncbi:MAG TPA: NrfD/PsrC family molybdoenzyme membrane anchor subunit, partial [Ramlibacter sp.]|nr:NrfD/PsrC family molybdoenzyme membrane anchor subunit [Ramlibacter sp.]
MIETELVQPRPSDGRNIDQTLGTLRGEGALQEIANLDEARPFETRPYRAEATAEQDSYYGLPLLKETVWKWAIPAYFYVGGLAGASAALSAASLLRGRALSQVARAGKLIAAGGAVASAALLIQDLGIRRRFIYMLRVFRPTSPMNLGSWILTAFGGAAMAALLPGRTGDAASVAAGVIGLPLTSYTGVLLANTAVPLWQGARTTLPPVFVASAAA